MLGLDGKSPSSAENMNKSSKVLNYKQTLLAVTVMFSSTSSVMADSDKPNVQGFERPIDDMPSLEKVMPRPKHVLSDKEIIAKEQADENLRLEWDEWHRKTKETLYWKNIVPSCEKAALAKSKPLTVTVSFRVQRDLQISDIQLRESSTSQLFNSIVTTSVISLSKNDIWKFPDGSVREFVDITCTFGWAHGGPTNCYFLQLWPRSTRK